MHGTHVSDELIFGNSFHFPKIRENSFSFHSIVLPPRTFSTRLNSFHEICFRRVEMRKIHRKSNFFTVAVNHLTLSTLICVMVCSFAEFPMVGKAQ